MAAKADLKTTISADMTGFSATMRRAGGLAATTGTKIGKSLGGAGKALGGIAKTSAIAGAGLAAVGAAAAGVGFTLGIKNAADLGGKLADLSARTGIAAGDLAVMGRAFEDNGVSADKIGGVINKLQKTITDFGTGSKTAAKPFEKLGISFDQISKLNPSDQFQLIQSKIAAIQSPTERAAVAMQLFGKSGGELLTLFSDGKAFANAGTFLGSQAEILNRNAALFDSISDILARAGEKFQGFFVGILDVIGPALLEVLQKFDSLDFAKMGQDAGGFIMEAVSMTGKLLDMAYQFGQRLGNGIEASGMLLREVFSADFWAAQGKFIVAAMGDGVNVLIAGVKAYGAMLLQLLQEMPNLVWNAWKFLTNPEFWGAVKDSLINVALTFAQEFTGILGKAFGLLKNLDFEGLKQMGKDIVDQITGGSKNGFKFEMGDSVKDSFDRIFEAGKDAFKNAGDFFDTSALKEDAMKAFAEIGGNWKEILNRPVESLPKALGDFVQKYKPQIEKMVGTQGGTSPTGAPRAAGAGRGFGEAVRPSNRVFGEEGAPLGTDNVFARDRARLGIASGVSTGGLGEKRRLNTSANDKEAKKNLSLQEQQAASLQSIESNIKSAVTVN